MKKAIIFGYHEIGCILIEELKKNNIDVSLIVGDYTKHKNQIHSWYRDIRKLAKDHKIQIIEKKSLDKKTVNLVKKLKPDLIFCAFTNYILTTNIINIPKLGCYNFHNSDLPIDRGRGAPIYTIMKGKKKTALTMHHITPKVDKGDIIDKEYIFLEKEDDIKRLYLKHNYALANILDRQLPKLKMSIKLKGYPQKETKKPNNLWIDGKSDLVSFKKMDAKQINNIVNSLKYPFIGAKCIIKKKIISIHDVEIYQNKIESYYKPGQIINICNYNFIVKTKKGYIKIKEFSYSGRHILPSHFAKLNKIKKLFFID
ncbi:formyltransferase family protein [Candidatus Pelagibacter ubique]|nr:formyltransferase family protein [Candidatus Pelagibacter ubique]